MRQIGAIRNGCLIVGALLAAAGGCRGEPTPANHLVRETSPYLLQHAHNPVDWYPWGEEAFQKAKREGKPIFLSIGYSSCHWCHVMEAESFENTEVATALNKDFVAIKVDREERPDLDDVYITALQMMNGSAGWPATLFLTPEGKPFFGATYLPRADLLTLLGKVQTAWADKDQHRRVTELADRFTTDLGRAAGRLPTPGSITPQIIENAAQGYREGLDARYGGFGKAPKFPPSSKLAAMLREYRRKPDPALLHAVTLTLDRMERGGMHDQIGGGFHRYSTDAQWLVPHFEKMLYDNALLAEDYLLAYQVTHEPRYRRTAVDTLEFALRELADPSGGFWSSLDADSPAPGGERGEGHYYTWTPAELQEVLGPKDAALFERCFGITGAGEVDGRSIPNFVGKSLAEHASAEKLSVADLERRLEPMVNKLREARARRPRPALDDKVLAGWNGLMLRSLALAYDVTGEPRYRTAAERCATFLLGPMRPNGHLAHSYRAGRAQPQVFLEDFGAVGSGLIELHRVTEDTKWLEGARSIVDEMIARCWDEKSGTFLTAARDQSGALVRTVGSEDGATPSPQSLAALALAGLARETGSPDYRQRASRLLSAFASDIKRFPVPAAGFVIAGQEQFQARTGVTAGGPVTVALENSPKTAGPGQVIELRVRFRLQPGWHINAPQAGSSVVSTRVEVAEGVFAPAGVSYPKSTPLRLPYATEPVPVLAGDPVVTVRVRAPSTPGNAELRLSVRYQPCNAQMCERPVETRLKALVTVR